MSLRLRRATLLAAAFSLALLAPLARTRALAVRTAERGVDGCTAIAVGKDASSNGSPMVTHSDDSGGAADIRVVRVPAADHAGGSHRPVYLSIGTFPRLLAPERAPGYARDTLMPGNMPEEARYLPLGFVPQVAHTYGYIDADYGISNEVGLVMGESTCSSKLGAAPIGVNNGTALFGIEELSKEYGYYGGAAAFNTIYGEPTG
ncbi:hypothetical protein T492DRAFT_866999 [Pavlovales sp. CCMP2436]|nr:hypothetical protein T492DRAFT_866999 [Pavlovales sp. CCMP2436]